MRKQKRKINFERRKYNERIYRIKEFIYELNFTKKKPMPLPTWPCTLPLSKFTPRGGAKKIKPQKKEKERALGIMLLSYENIFPGKRKGEIKNSKKGM